MSAEFAIVPAGDASLVVEFEERIDTKVASRVVLLAERVRLASLPGILDIVPTFRSLAVHFDPLRADTGHVVRVLTALASEHTPEADGTDTPMRVPVCYGGAFGPDLEHVAACAGLDAATVVSLHTAIVYRVFMLGFAPGFAYLGPLDDRIAVPRRPTPRTRVLAGSVAIAGKQTGVYPLDSPGGWQVIGRTPLRPFDLARAEPFLFKAGNRVEFYAVDREEYDGTSVHSSRVQT